MDNVVSLVTTERDRLVCTVCLASVEIPCDCGAKHKRMKPAELARNGILKYPNLSDRELANRLGIGYMTIARVKSNMANAPNGATAPILPQRRLTKDGKLRTVSPSPPSPSPPEIVKKPTQWHSCSTNQIPLPKTVHEAKARQAAGFILGLSVAELKLMAQYLKERDTRRCLKLRGYLTHS